MPQFEIGQKVTLSAVFVIQGVLRGQYADAEVDLCDERGNAFRVHNKYVRHWLPQLLSGMFIKDATSTVYLVVEKERVHEDDPAPRVRAVEFELIVVKTSIKNMSPGTRFPTSQLKVPYDEVEI